MMVTNIGYGILSLLIALTLGACNFSTEWVDQDQIDAQSTASHETVVAKLTEIAALFTQTPLPPTEEASPTPNTNSATSTPTPTATTAPTATPTPLPCDQASFISDITIADGTTLSPGDGFTKTWRLKNVGICTWTSDYDLVFVKGDQLKAKNIQALSGDVKPGEAVDLSVNMVAPSNEGDYAGYWMLRNASGKLFGLGTKGDQVFWVNIKVKRIETKVAYKFVPHYCEAEWRSADGELSCPGAEGDEGGFVLKVDSPRLEGRNEDEPILYTHPEIVEDGWIKGRFPGIDIKDGDTFATYIGCLHGASGCNVKFQLEYEGRDGFVHRLGRWHEVYEGKIRPIEIDLSKLAGDHVRFIFRVEANGEAEEDQAFWLNPRILRIDD
jgi:hypothetical protein